MFRILFILILLIGFNFIVWSAIGLLRYFSELRRTFIQETDFGKIFMNSLWSSLTVSIIALACIFLFGIITRSIEVIKQISISQSSYLALVIIVLWSFFSFIAGFVATRVTLTEKPYFAFITGGLFWFFLEVIQLGKSLEDPNSILRSIEWELAIVHIGALIASLLLAYSGYLVANKVNVLTRKDLKKKKKLPKADRIYKKDVAAVMAAFNEEETLEKTVRSLQAVLPSSSIFVGSDGSKDRTLEIGKSLGINIYHKENSGKANTLRQTIEKYDLLNKYKAIIFIDADSTIEKDYLSHALPLFNSSSDIAAVAVHATSRFPKHTRPSWEMFFAAYRVRFYRVLQAMFRYGQTWQYTNVSTIVPGFASIYRTRVLKHIEIDAPGLVIEDFNMTFELQHKNLGRIAYSPAMKATTIDPPNMKLYYKQIKRWNLGFWQTIKRHGFWPSKFWASLAPYIAEIVPLSLFFLIFSPFAILWFITHSFEPFTVTIGAFSVTFTFLNLIIGLFVIDYLFTAVTAIYERKPWLLFYGLGFLVMRFVDAFVMLYTLPQAFTTQSTGAWIPPRKSNEPQKKTA